MTTKSDTRATTENANMTRRSYSLKVDVYKSGMVLFDGADNDNRVVLTAADLAALWKILQKFRRLPEMRALYEVSWTGVVTEREV